MKSKELTTMPEFKAGDWVEIEWECKLVTHEQIKIVRKGEFLIQPDNRCCFTAIDIASMKHETLDIKCLRKLDPAEVVIQIGCLRGTVSPCGLKLSNLKQFSNEQPVL